VNRSSQAPLVFFAIGIIGLGILALVFRRFRGGGADRCRVGPWPNGSRLRFGCRHAVGRSRPAARRTTALSVRILLPFLIVGFLLQVPTLVMTPLVEGQLGERRRGCRARRADVGSLSPRGSGLEERDPGGLRHRRQRDPPSPGSFCRCASPIGLSHFAYLEHTVSLVPDGFPSEPAGPVGQVGAGSHGELRHRCRQCLRRNRLTPADVLDTLGAPAPCGCSAQRSRHSGRSWLHPVWCQPCKMPRRRSISGLPRSPTKRRDGRVSVVIFGHHRI